MELFVKHDCGWVISPKSYCFPAQIQAYQWEYLHVYHCGNKDCPERDFMKWHGVYPNGFTNIVCCVAQNSKQERLWQSRLHHLLNQKDSGSTVSQATEEISRDPYQGDNARKTIARMTA